jgi:hypothetical protein
MLGKCTMSQKLEGAGGSWEMMDIISPFDHYKPQWAFARARQWSSLNGRKSVVSFSLRERTVKIILIALLVPIPGLILIVVVVPSFHKFAIPESYPEQAEYRMAGLLMPI